MWAEAVWFSLFHKNINYPILFVLYSRVPVIEFVFYLLSHCHKLIIFCLHQFNFLIIFRIILYCINITQFLLYYFKLVAFWKCDWCCIYRTNRVVVIYDRHGEQRDEINIPGSVVLLIFLEPWQTIFYINGFCGNYYTCMYQHFKLYVTYM